MEHIESIKNSKHIFLLGYFEEYYLNNDEYPKNIFDLDSSLIDYAKNSKEKLNKDRDAFIQNTFIDPFNDNGYFIVPIYNRKNKRIEDIYVLSVGADSECNNFFRDSIYTDDSISLNLYRSSKFSYLNYYFGTKDILIFHLKGKHFLLNQVVTGQKCIPVEKVHRLFERKHPLHRVVCITGKVDSIIKSNTNLTIFFRNNNGEIRCKMDELYKVEVGDKIQIIAVYKRKSDHTLYFSNCISLQTTNQ